MIAARLLYGLMSMAGVAGAIGNLPEPREAVLAWALLAVTSLTALLVDVAHGDNRRAALAALRIIEAQQEMGRAIEQRLVEALDLVSTCATDAQRIGRAESP